MKDIKSKTSYLDFYFPDNETAEAHTVRHFENETGTGVMHCFHVAPGIQISFNKLEMTIASHPLQVNKDFLQLNYCLDGSYELRKENGDVSFLGKGDISLSSMYPNQPMAYVSQCPLGFYKGITILIEIESAQKTLAKSYRDAHIDLKEIRQRLCADEHILLIEPHHMLNRCFAELYNADERIQIPYFYLKIAEILLLVSILNETHLRLLQHFSLKISHRTQDVHRYIVDNPFTQKTISEMSEMFDIAESSLKRCFKSLTGVSVGTFMKTKRMEAAAELLLQEKDLSINEISMISGYGNQGKFSAAFKSVFGMTPFMYRCKHS